jgi:hypothetical protein
MPRFTHPLPENIRKCLPVALRTCTDTRTATEEAEVFDQKSEKLIHHTFEAWLMLNEIPYVHSRMDKKSTIRVGWPDFSIFYARQTVFVEFKQAGKQLSPEQHAVRNELIAKGFEVSIHTDPGEAIIWTKAALGIN